jgi:hypothetical protein
MFESSTSDNKITRPPFLNVLCILSFIGSGWNAFNGLFSAINAGDIEPDQLQTILSIYDNFQFPFPQFKADLETYTVNSLLNAGNLGTGNFMLYSISLIGVYQMYSLQKIGFYIYGAAQLTMPFVALIFGGSNSIGWYVFGLTTFFSFLFIFLYKLNYKHLH